MGWGGSVSAMIQSLRNNKELLGKKKYHKSKVKALQASEKLKISYSKATSKELQLVREKIKKDQRLNRIKTILVLVLLSPFIGFVFYNLWLAIKEEIPKTKDQLIMEFYHNIKEGDTFFKKKQFDNAVIFYESAEEIFPNSSTIRIRMGMVSTMECLYENENCGHAAWVVRKFENIDSTQTDMLKLKELLIKGYKLNNSEDTSIAVRR